MQVKVTARWSQCTRGGRPHPLCRVGAAPSYSAWYVRLHLAGAAPEDDGGPTRAVPARCQRVSPLSGAERGKVCQGKGVLR